MRCERCRELVSARLDGEAGPDVPEGAVDAHLAACTDCHAWAERAAAVTRLARTGPAEPGPDLTDAVVAASRTLPAVVRRRRAGIGVRAGLALVGAGQLVLAAIGVAGAAATDHDGMHHVGGASVAHALHETSAWNLAMGIGFLAVAYAGGRLVAGLLPVTGAFVVVLGVLSALDLVAGRVEPDRLLTHALVLAGFVLLLLHRRVLGDGGGRTAPARQDRSPVGASDSTLPWIGPAAGPGAVASEDRRVA